MNPYPGLRPFQESDHDVFFGREEETDVLLQRLAARRLTAVLGVSGCGKSSLVRAGVIPLLRTGLAEGLEGDWDILTLVPGSAPLDALNTATGATLPRRSHALRDWARSRNDDGTKILLLVDQFEEIFAYRKQTLASDGGNSATLFVDQLLTAVEDPSVPLYLIFTMRTDYLGEAAVFRGLAEALNDVHYLVPRLTRMQLQDSIERPAQSQGITVQPALMQRLLTDAEDDPDKLPVLQHLLKRIWESRGDGPMDLAAYGKTGGWKDAIRLDAEGVLDGFPTERDGVRRLFQWITDVGTGDKPVRRRRPLAEIPTITGVNGARVTEIVHAFAKRGFLYVTGDGSIDLTHESVMWQWPELKQWIEQEASEGSRLRFYREAAYKEVPLTGSTLKEAQIAASRIKSAPQWAARYLDKPGDVALLESWIAVSARQEYDEIARLKGDRWTLMLGLGAALAMLAVMWWFWWEARQSKRTANEQVARNYWEKSREARTAEWHVEALQYGAAAIAAAPQMRAAVQLDLRTVQAPELLQMLAHQGPVNGAVFSNDEKRILSWGEDRTARIWNVQTGAVLQEFRESAPVAGAQFNKDESRVLTWAYGKYVTVWGPDRGTPLPPMERILAAAFRPDGTSVFVQADSSGRIFDAKTAAQKAEFADKIDFVTISPDQRRLVTTGPEGTRFVDFATGKYEGASMPPAGRAAFSADGSLIVTVADAQGKIWTAPDGRQVGPTVPLQEKAKGAVLSRDNSRILSWGDDGTARVWDRQTGTCTVTMRHRSEVKGASFSPDESRILTWSTDQSARLWDAKTGDPDGPGFFHQGKVTGAAFTRDGRRVLTWSRDGTARVWNAAKIPSSVNITPAAITGARLTRDEKRVLVWAGNDVLLMDLDTRKRVGVTQSGLIRGAELSAAEDRILTWSEDGARVFDSRTGDRVIPELRHRSAVDGAIFSRDARRVVTWSQDGIRVWDATTGNPIGNPIQPGSSANGVTFNKDETQLLAWNSDGTVRLWKLGTSQPVVEYRHEGIGFDADDIKRKSVALGALLNRNETEILSWGTDGTVKVWSIHSAKQQFAFPHGSPTLGAAFTRDERRILCWSNGSLALWDVRRREPVRGIQDDIAGARFSNDESRILTWGTSARLWEPETGKPLGPALQHGGVIRGAVFNRSDTRVLTWSDDATARLWDAKSGKQISRAFRHPGQVYGAILTHDETRLLTWGLDSLRIWLLDADLDFPVESVSTWTQAATGSEFDPVTGEIRAMYTERWREVRAQYEKVATEHARSCQYRDANQWLRWNQTSDKIFK